MTPELKAVPMDELSPLITGLIEDGTDVRFTVTGISMRPLLYNRRDSVVLTACDPQLLKKGQIPLYKRPDGTYVLHRIIKVGKNSYDMCGDHQWEIERGVDKSSVICVVKGFYRNGVYHSCKAALSHVFFLLDVGTAAPQICLWAAQKTEKKKLINRMVSVPSVDFFIYRQIEHSVI